MDYIQQILHYSNHFLVPLIIAVVFFRKEWKKVTVVLWLTMLVDLDHLLATPIFQEGRCSIGFHPLHSYYAIAFYVVLLFFRKYHIIAIGLVWHMITDGIDCLMMKL